jgi:hypothetical protein
MREASLNLLTTLNYSMSCHTLDRFNLIAHKDCGAPVHAPEDYQSKKLFAKTLDSHFQTWYWSFTREPEALKCMN